MLGRNDVVRLVAHGSSDQRCCGITAWLVRFIHFGGIAALGLEIGRERLLLVLDTHERCGEFCGFPVIRDD